MKTALVLSAGGMFGAYQAGAWEVISNVFQPDLVVGASIGAVNGWAIAGGCRPEELTERWLRLDCAASYRLRAPRSIHGGFFDGSALADEIRSVYLSYTPQIEYALVVTRSRTLQPRLFRAGEVTPEILRASTAIPAVFDQVRIGGKLYCDGGLVGALPVWAARELGADRIVAVNAMTPLTGLLPRLIIGAFRSFSRSGAVIPSGDLQLIAPRQPFGSGRDMLCWNRANAERWIEQGRHDAAVRKHSLENCFQAQ
jgi:NTE family protein